MEGGTWDQGKGCCVWQQLVHSSWEGKKKSTVWASGWEVVKAEVPSRNGTNSLTS